MGNKKNFKLFYAILITFYSLSFIYSIVNIFHKINLDKSEAILAAIECIVAVVCAFLPKLVEKIFKVEVDFAVTLFLSIYVFGAAFLGEICRFYYIFTFWDAFLHVLMAFFLAYLGFMIGNQLFKDKSNKTKSLIIITYTAFCFSLSVGLVWELIEFTIDSLFGTNMQKFIPQDDNLWNGGSAFEILNGTDKEIADFFKQPKGYRYALSDTMQDLVCDFFGTILGTILSIIKYNKDEEFFYRMMNSKTNPYIFKDIKNTSN